MLLVVWKGIKQTSFQSISGLVVCGRRSGAICLAIKRNFIFLVYDSFVCILQRLFDWQIFVERLLWVILVVSVVTVVIVFLRFYIAEIIPQ